MAPNSHVETLSTDCDYITLSSFVNKSFTKWIKLELYKFPNIIKEGDFIINKRIEEEIQCMDSKFFYVFCDSSHFCCNY